MENLIRINRNLRHPAIDIKGVLDDRDAFAQASEYMYGMFEREVFDFIVCIAEAGSYFADAVSKRMDKKLICMWENKNQKEQPVCAYETHHAKHVLAAPPGSIPKGQKAVIITDVLTHGKNVAAAVKMIEDAGSKVIKIGTFVEETGFNARKKVLRPIPVEGMFLSDDV